MISTNGSTSADSLVYKTNIAMEAPIRGTNCININVIIENQNVVDINYCYPALKVALSKISRHIVVAIVENDCKNTKPKVMDAHIAKAYTIVSSMPWTLGLYD